MTEETQVKCLLMPLQRGVLLVPNAVVAEILNNQPLTPAPMGTPGWQIGEIDWRDERRLKVISFEEACGERLPVPPKAANVAVMYSIDNTKKNRYYGVYITDVPKFEIVDASALALSPYQPGNAHCIASRIVINGVEGYIPDLDEMARLVT